MNDSQSATHRRVWEDLPWLLNGTLDEERRAHVLAHLQQCPDCREEYEFQRKVRAGIREETPHAAADLSQGWTRLAARIDGADDDQQIARRTSSLAGSRTRAHARGRRGERALVAALLAQSVLLVLFGIALVGNDRRDGAGYRTLASATTYSPVATIRWVPEPTMSIARIQSLLASAHLRVVETNADGSIFGLAPLPTEEASESDSAVRVADATAQAITFLRAQPGVLLAEPITRSGDGTP